MTPPAISNSDRLVARFIGDSEAELPASRSPAVSGAIALGISGCLLASAADSPLPHGLITIALLFPAMESEIRSFRVPIWLGGLGLLGAWTVGFSTGGAEAGIAGLAGSTVMAFVLAPLFGLRIVQPGAWLIAVALGALWGTAPLQELLLWCALLGCIFVSFRLSLGADPRTLPLTPVLGLAAACQPLF